MTESDMRELLDRVEAAAARVRAERGEYITATIHVVNFPAPIPVDCAFASDGPAIVRALYDAAFREENRDVLIRLVRERGWIS